MSAHHLTRVKVGEGATLQNLPFSCTLAQMLLNQIQVHPTPVPVSKVYTRNSGEIKETADINPPKASVLRSSKCSSYRWISV